MTGDSNVKGGRFERDRGSECTGHDPNVRGGVECDRGSECTGDPNVRGIFECKKGI